jgi:ABC-type Fe3+-hydroxamate transport system substrate-binding protein|tara:strand:+ start:127232 stop:128005 length:774 start_codon:yes stop_codon:yes gene_type:complete
MLVTDQLHRKVTIPTTPSRIVSLVPSQTELLVSLGLSDSIVGVTKFCVHPPDFRKQKTMVGGTKKVSFEKIEKLNPDFILCNKEENTKEMVEQLETIAPVWVSDIYTIDDVHEMIVSLGEILAVSDRANQLKKSIIEAQNEFNVFIQNRPFKKVAYVIWKNPWMLAGRNTFINDLLALNHFENILGEKSSRYPEVTAETLKQSDLILLSSEPYPFTESDVDELKKALQNEVLLVDGEYFSWYGSRLKDAFDYFKSLH